MKKVLTAFAALLLLVLGACQKAPELTITGPASLELSADGSSGTITFNANRDWTISTSDSWVSVSPSSGTASDGPITVTVRCNANTTYEDRKATVTIKMEDLTQAVTITQPANLGIILPSKSYNLESGASTFTVEVQANVAYSVSTSVDWIKQTGTKGLIPTTYYFSVEENTTYDNREGTITIKSQNSSVADQVISVKQAQKDAIIVENSSYDMPYGGGEIEVKVEANVDFEVKTGEEWIHHIETKALNSSTVRLSIDENTGYGFRESIIEIKQHNGTIMQTITIKQKGRPDPSVYVGNAVDLGIVMTREDGSTYTLLWADSNLGTDKPEDSGNHYAWGEIDVKSEYSWSTYKWGTADHYKLTKYCYDSRKWVGSGDPDGKMVLDPEDDVAHMKLGGKWRMPTHAEWNALFDNCTQLPWTTQNGVKGILMTSKKNSNSIFLPVTGYYDSPGFRYGDFGYYWSSSLDSDSSPTQAMRFRFFVETSGSVGDFLSSYRSLGFAVRPVSE